MSWAGGFLVRAWRALRAWMRDDPGDVLDEYGDDPRAW